jgi:hypothetical protein
LGFGKWSGWTREFGRNVADDLQMICSQTAVVVFRMFDKGFVMSDAA